jgi:hypothetical protein
VVGGHPPLQQLADGQEGRGAANRPVLGEPGGELTPALLGVLECSVEPKGALDRAARDGIDADRDADLEDARPTLAQRSLASDAHRSKNRARSRVTGGSLLRRSSPIYRLNRENTVTMWRARQDSNLQPSDP